MKLTYEHKKRIVWFIMVVGILICGYLIGI